jgi:hypothetical protein
MAIVKKTDASARTRAEMRRQRYKYFFVSLVEDDIVRGVRVPGGG